MVRWAGRGWLWRGWVRWVSATGVCSSHFENDQASGISDKRVRVNLRMSMVLVDVWAEFSGCRLVRRSAWRGYGLLRCAAESWWCCLHVCCRVSLPVLVVGRHAASSRLSLSSVGGSCRYCASLLLLLLLRGVCRVSRVCCT